MPDLKISELPAVVTPAPADEFAVNQSGVSRRETRAQIHALESGEHLIIPTVNEPATPTLAIGSGGTSGFFNPVSTLIGVAINGVSRWIFTGTDFNGTAGSSAGLRSVTSGPQIPTVLPSAGDGDTGIGSGGAVLDLLALIAGGIEGIRLTEASSFVLQAPDSNVGLTADVGSGQGDGVILCSYNVYSTVANVGDAATLPAVFKVGTVVFVKNDGANSMDVFPASGDDAGGGVDTAVAVAAGATQQFLATAADATWTQLV